jgi:hypothetical protein
MIELGGEMLMKIPKPTYKRIEITLPQIPQGGNLPRSIFFDMDIRLNEGRVRTVIVRLLADWRRHYEETAADGTSEWAACTRTYATRNLTPVWLNYTREQSITNGEEALEFAIDTLTSFFRQNGFMQVPIAKIDYANIPSNVFAISENGECEFGVPLDVTMNAQPLNTLNDILLAGSLIHAWMHRMGYRHPSCIYTSYLIGEAAMCLIRGFQGKVPGQPDSVLTQFLA